MEPRLPFTLRILACKLLKKFILKSARPRTRLVYRARSSSVLASILYAREKGLPKVALGRQVIYNVEGVVNYALVLQ